MKSNNKKQEKNITSHVVQEAMRQTSKDVTKPKVVRDGIVKEKNYERERDSVILDRAKNNKIKTLKKLDNKKLEKIIEEKFSNLLDLDLNEPRFKKAFSSFLKKYI